MIAVVRFLIAGVNVVALLLIVLGVRCYQMTLSHWIGRHCRYRPTCSNYCLLAVKRYGPWVGSWMTAGRLLRCHPWSPGGWDPP